MSEKYFVAYLKNGEIFRNNRCNRVSYKDPNYVVFKHALDLNNENAGYETLAIIPHNQIRKIVVKEEPINNV